MKICQRVIKKRHLVYKSKIGIFISDLIIIMININFLLQNQHQKFIIALDKAENNTFMAFKEGNTMIYQDFTSYLIFLDYLKYIRNTIALLINHNFYFYVLNNWLVS